MSRVEEIKSWAVELMAVHSFAGVSLRQLAEVVGIRPGSIYAHYPSKNQLLSELCCEFYEDLLAEWHEQRQSADPRRDLASFVKAYVCFHLARRAESRVVLFDFRCLDDSGKESVLALRSQYESELEGILRHGVQRGEFHIANTADACLCILTLMQGFCFEAGEKSAQEIISACIDAAHRLLGCNQL